MGYPETITRDDTDGYSIEWKFARRAVGDKYAADFDKQLDKRERFFTAGNQVAIYTRTN